MQHFGASALTPHTCSENSESYTHTSLGSTALLRKDFALLCKSRKATITCDMSVRPRGTAGHPVDGFSLNSVSIVFYYNMSTQCNSIIPFSNFCCYSKRYTLLSVCSELAVIHLTAPKTTSFLICIKCSTCFVL